MKVGQTIEQDSTQKQARTFSVFQLSLRVAFMVIFRLRNESILQLPAAISGQHLAPYSLHHFQIGVCGIAISTNELVFSIKTPLKSTHK